MAMSPELAGPKTATERVRVFPESWSEAFPQALNEICVPLSPTDIAIAGKSIASNLAGCAGKMYHVGGNDKIGKTRILDFTQFYWMHLCTGLTIVILKNLFGGFVPR